MVEECGKIVPESIAPSVHEVNSWLSSRLALEKKEQKSGQDRSRVNGFIRARGKLALEKKEQKSGTNAGPTRKKTRNKTQREKRQEEATVIKVAKRPQIGDSTKHHLYLAK
jgi:hypothetical protein